MRLLLAQAGVQYLDTRISKASWDKRKPKPDMPYDKLPLLEVWRPKNKNGKRKPIKKTSIESPLKIANYIADKYGLRPWHAQDDKARAEVIVKECLDFINTGTEDQKMETNFYKAGRLLV